MLATATIVGVGKSSEGRRLGFVFETDEDNGFLEGVILPPRVAMKDKEAARLAKLGGPPIMTRLVALAMRDMGEPIEEREP
jgi:hypothetical protein